jgi:hypothetical protein
MGGLLEQGFGLPQKTLQRPVAQPPHLGMTGAPPGKYDGHPRGQTFNSSHFSEKNLSRD